MTGTNFAALVREYTRTNSSTFTDANIVLLANTVKDDFAKEIVKADEDLFGLISTRNLVASSTSDITAREYTLPEKTLKIKYVEAKLDGTNWVTLREFDLTTYRRTTDESRILSTFANEEGKAFFDLFRRSLWIYSGTITATTDGLVIRTITLPADISTGDLSGSTDLSEDPTSTTFGMPIQFHELWARRVSMLYKGNREKPIPYSERELLFDRDFEMAMSATRNPNLNRDMQGHLPDDTRLQY